MYDYNEGMNDTGILWTQKTWNPVSGCDKVSEGYKFCYAEVIAERFGAPAYPNGFGLTLRPHKLQEPFRLKEPALIFVNSMSDLFWEEISDDYRDQILEVMEQTPQHQYQVLTKRPAELLRYSQRHKLPSNFWAGVTIESIHTAARIDLLRQVDVPIHFISAEPLLDDLGSVLHLKGIQWLITGGESGRHLFDPATRERRGLVNYEKGKWLPRPERMDWIRHLRDLCITNKVAHLFKQWGGLTPKSAGRELDGQTWDEFPLFPTVFPKAA